MNLRSKFSKNFVFLEIVKLLVDNNVNLNYVKYYIKLCNDINIFEYIADNFNNIDINDIYLKCVKVKNLTMCEYIEKNYNLNYEFLLFNGDIELIKNVDYYNTNILYRNSEEDCIDLFKSININNFSNISEVENFLFQCIFHGYLKLSIFIMKDKNIKLKFINNFVIYSKCEDDALKFLNFLTDNKYMLNKEIILNDLTIKGYFNILELLYDEQIYKINIYTYICNSIRYNNIETFKYLMNLRLHNNENIENFFELSIDIKNIEVIKYLVENNNFLIKNSLNIVNKFFISINDENYIDIIKYLVNIGAYMNFIILKKVCDYCCFTTIDYLLNIKINSNDDDLEILIGGLIYLNKTNILNHILNKYINYVKLEFTYLEYAINKNYYNLFEILIKYIETNNDILIKAYNNDNLNIVILLVEKGIDINILKEHIKDNKRDINDYLLCCGLII